MVCDWESANFEQNHILKDTKFYTTIDWFGGIRNIGWSKDQQKFIEETIKKIDLMSNYDDIIKICQPLID